MSEWLRVSRRTAVVGLALAMAGCAGPLADVLMAGTGSRDVSGEVRRVDERSRVVHVGSWLGTSAIRYDGRTRVVYNGRQYPVRSLEHGDRVTVAVRRQNRGDLYADRIYVQQSARHAGRHEDRRHARVQYADGRVHRIDQRQGWFEVRPERGAAVRVTLPHRASRRQLNDFQRLRRGDWVRVEGIRLQGNRMEMVRII